MLNKEKNVKIFVCHHKNFDFVKNDCIIPIQVGKENSKNELTYCIGDDTGDNISRLNSSWCELTALYWMWKNVEADYLGLMHYRRYLTFNNHGGYYVVSDLDEKVIQDYGLSESFVRNECSKYDIITAPVWNTHPVGLPWKIVSNYDHYCSEHYKKDIDIVIDIIKEKYPEYYLPTIESLYSTSCFFGNIMICREDIFNRYCEFLFGVLFDAQTKIDTDGYDKYQGRIWGFIAERLSNAFVLKELKDNPELKVSQRGILFVAEKGVSKDIIENMAISDRTEITDDTVHICLSFDNNYSRHADAAIFSTIANANPLQKITFHILCDEHLSKENRDVLESHSNNYVSFIFYDIDKKLFSSLPLNRGHISINTYYRLVIHKLLGHLDKVIYIDSDVITLGNITELWNEDIEGFAIGAALDEGGVLQSRRLALGDDNSYINAGVLIINIKEINIRYADVFSTYMENFYINNREITLQDQDVLNITFAELTKIIPLKWNINSRIFSVNDLEKKYSSGDAEKAVLEPGIVHFTDRKKPWVASCSHPLKGSYWKYRELSARYPLSLREKFIKKIAGDITYEINGSLIVVKINKFKFKLSKRLVAMILRKLKINF